MNADGLARKEWRAVNGFAEKWCVRNGWQYWGQLLRGIPRGANAATDLVVDNMIRIWRREGKKKKRKRRKVKFQDGLLKSNVQSRLLKMKMKIHVMR